MSAGERARAKAEQVVGKTVRKAAHALHKETLAAKGAALETRVAQMKRLCGAGGTLKGEVVEIQGDHRERLAEHLRAAGFTVKLAGG